MKHALLPIVALVSTAVAQPASTAAPLTSPSAEPVSSAKVAFLDILQQGGIMMIPLGALSIIAVCLILYYMAVIRRGAVVSNRFMTNAENLILQGNLANLSELCHQNSSAVAKILGRSVDFLQATPTSSLDEIREVAVAEGSRQAGILSQRITYLSDVGSVAPMAGLLGTVIGMIKSFMEIAEGNFEGVTQMQLASGVSEALITTATGLVIGLIAVIFYSFFRGKVNRYIAELEAASTHLMAVLSSVNSANRTYLSNQKPAPAATAQVAPVEPVRHQELPPHPGSQH